MRRWPVVLLMGPTASGKTEFALRIAAHLPSEIVSVDSALVYRGLDIGSAKPSPALRAQVPHHLIDILDPAEAYSAARFVADAANIIAGIERRGRVPLLVGGTMLYFHALLHGLNELPAADPGLRARLEAEGQALGWPAMHRRLAEIDPVTAARLAPNDRQRVQRALEIASLTGQPASAWHARPRRGSVEGRVVKLALHPGDREALHARIRRRLMAMMAEGFLDEVRHLHARPDLHADLPALRAVGYRQLWQHLEGAFGEAEAVERAVTATRQLAKRQLTWLRADPDIVWLDAASPAALEQALELVNAAAVET